MTRPIAVQLYTLRKEAEADFPAVLARLGEVGYAGVETAGLHDLSAAEFRRHLDAAGLEVASAHSPIPLGDKANAILDGLEEIGTPNVISMFGPDRFESADAVRATADDFNRALAAVRARGLRFGYHNHWWEFQNQVDGRPAWELFSEQLDPEICFEIDIYWAQVGGAVPADVIRAGGPRSRLLHVKDGPADEPRAAMTAVGEGVVDIAAALEASEVPEWHIVELDRCATDMMEAVEKSHAWLVGKGLSRGQGTSA